MVCVFSCTQIYYITFCFKDFGLEKYPKEDRIISLIAGVAALFNGIGRFLSSFIGERYSFYKCMFLAVGL